MGASFRMGDAGNLTLTLTISCSSADPFPGPCVAYSRFGTPYFYRKWEPRRSRDIRQEPQWWSGPAPALRPHHFKCSHPGWGASDLGGCHAWNIGILAQLNLGTQSLLPLNFMGHRSSPGSLEVGGEEGLLPGASLHAQVGPFLPSCSGHSWPVGGKLMASGRPAVFMLLPLGLELWAFPLGKGGEGATESLSLASWTVSPAAK
jgi:hypothetical protein